MKIRCTQPSPFRGPLACPLRLPALALRNPWAQSFTILFLLLAFWIDVEPLSARSPAFEGASSQNTATLLPPAFSHSRGFYNEPFALTLTAPNPSAEIRYTLDGSPPSPSANSADSPPVGTLYDQPILIETTTVVRVLAYMPDGLLADSRQVVHTYIFPEQVLHQQGTPPGYPDRWSELPADYDMDPEIVADPDYEPALDRALLSIPTVSLTFNRPDFFDAERGIYQNPRESGPEWERPVSFEILYPDGRSGAQEHGGIQIQGDASRKPESSPKHSLRLSFRSRYGATKFRHPLFEDALYTDDPVDEFNSLSLRAHYNYSWIHRKRDERSDALYIRDPFAVESQRAMGHRAIHQMHVHLYLNGLYWGLYILQERPEAAYMADYFGGDKDEYDAIKVGEAVDGNGDAWSKLLGFQLQDTQSPEIYRSLESILNVANFTDYMLLNHFIGNTDWDDGNWYAGRRRDSENRFHFYSWDAEKSMRTPETHTILTQNLGSPSALFHHLIKGSDYRLFLADRIHKHLQPGGALSVDATQARVNLLTDHIADAVVAESARWGDYRRDVHSYKLEPYELYTLEDHWLPARQWLLDEYLAVRGDILIEKYRHFGLYPNVDAPAFSLPGGPVAMGAEVTISSPYGDGAEIWYTLDGSEPRGLNADGSPRGTGTIGQATVRLERSTLLKARVYNNGIWSALQEAEYYPLSDEVPQLSIRELMVDPVEGRHAEYIEIVSDEPVPLDIGGLTFVDGISYRFPAGAVLQPDDRLVLAKTPEIFREIYGIDPFNQRGYEGNLKGTGEEITLVDAHNRPVLALDYRDDGAELTATQGAGFSIEIESPPAGASGAQSPLLRPSGEIGGSPGRAAAASTSTGRMVLINEVVAIVSVDGSVGGWVDGSLGNLPEPFVELYNQNEQPIDVGGWLLSDSPELAQRFQIPFGTIIDGHGFLVFWREQLGFDLTSGVYLFGVDASGALTGYGDRYGANDEGNSALRLGLGRCRWPDEPDASYDWIPLQDGTPNQPNRYGYQSPLVISELMYHPLENQPEYVELVNLGNVPARFGGSESRAVGSWSIDGIGDLTLSAAAIVEPNELLILTNVAPDEFRQAYPLENDVQVIGPYDGKLQNSGETISLYREGTPLPHGERVIDAVDRVQYSDSQPWPTAPDGNGYTLERALPSGYGNSHRSWLSSSQLGGTPGNVSHAFRASSSDDASAGTIEERVPALGDSGLPVVTYSTRPLYLPLIVDSAAARRQVQPCR